MRLFEDNPLLINRMKTLKEVHFDFLTAESSVFHLDQPDAMIRLFARPDTSFSTLIGRKLATLCITLNEYPNIRYQSSSTFARTIATTVYQVLTEYKKSNNSFVPYGEDASADRDRGQLIIFDRMFDPLTPLLHEFTYQAMANDLLTLDENGMIKYDTTTEKGDKIKKEAILNSEADELWVEHRHKHIAKVIDSNKQRMKDILSTNPGAAKILKDKAKGDVDMGTMASAVRNLPQYQQLMSDLGRHVTITSMCMREFSNQNLLALSAVEQTLATGIDEEGKEVKGKKAVELTISFLQSNTGLTRDQKLRLLMIFFVTQRPVSLEDRRPVIGAARLTNVDQVPLVNISNLMDSFSGDVGSLARDNSASSTASQPAKGGFFSSLFGKRVKETEKIASTAEGDYTDTRHVSGLRQVVEKAIVGQLPTERFTSVGPSLPQQSGSQGTAQSVRKFKPTDRWASKASSGHSALTGGRVIVFVAGGLTYAEMKDGADIMAKEGREVIVGGTHISNSTKYLEDIRKLEAI